MPARCATCAHPDLAGLNRALVAGTPATTVAEQYGLSVGSVRRHSKSHLGGQGDRLGQVRDALRAASLDVAEEIVSTLGDKPTEKKAALILVCEALVRPEKLTSTLLGYGVRMLSQEKHDGMDGLREMLKMPPPEQRPEPPIHADHAPAPAPVDPWGIAEEATG